MKRIFIMVLYTAPLALAVAACFLWIRGIYGVDEAMLQYDRYLADGRCASDAVYLTSDNRFWLTVIRGSVGPYNGQLVWGYHVNADQSGGKPRFNFNHSGYASNIFSSEGRLPTDDHSMSGWGPLRWQDFRRSGNGEQFRSIKVGVSHWLIVALLTTLSVFGIYRLRGSLMAKES